MTISDTRPLRPPTSLKALLSGSKKHTNGDGVLTKLEMSVDRFDCIASKTASKCILSIL
jgi:hypothetical protein